MNTSTYRQMATLRHSSTSIATIILLLTLTFSQNINAGQTLSGMPTSQNEPVLIEAAKKNELDLIAHSNAIKINIFFQTEQEGKTLAHSAAEHNSIDVLKFLLEKIDKSQLKSFIDTKDRYGNSAIHLATFKGHKEIVELLLKQPGITIQTKNGKGNTPLHIAALENHEEILKLFIGKGLSVNVQNNQQNTPLHLAASNNSNDTLKILLEHKNIKINVKNKDGNTPLNLAIKYKELDAIETLLKKKNIDLTIKNNVYKTAKDLAKETGGDVLEKFKSVLKEKLKSTLKPLKKELNKNESKLKEKNTKIKQLKKQLERQQEKQRESDEREKMEQEDIHMHKLKLEDSLAEKERLEKSNIELQTTVTTKKHLVENIRIQKINKKKESEEQIKAAIKIQCLVKGYLERKKYLKKKESTIKIQAWFRNQQARQRFLNKKNAAIKIQSWLKGQPARKEFLQKKESSVKIQSFARGYLERVNLIKEKLLHEMSFIENSKSQTRDDLERLKKLKLEVMPHINRFAKLEDKNRNTILHLFATCGLLDDKFIEKFVDNGGDISGRNNNRQTALWLSFLYGHKKNIKELYPHIKIDCALIKWINESDENKELKEITSEIQKYSENNPKKNAIKIQRSFRAKKKYKNGNTILHEWAEQGRLNKWRIKDFIKFGCDINAQDDNGNTALHFSILNGYDDQTKLLIKHGADISTTNNDGETPLHYAIATHNNSTFLTQEEKPKPKDNTELIKHLINEKTINAKDTNNNTPLHWAGYFGQVDLIEIFIKNGATVNIQNNEGGTPLHLASIQNHPETVEKLIELNASVLIKDFKVKRQWFDKETQNYQTTGYTPWDYVTNKKEFKKVEAILDKQYLPQLEKTNPKKYNRKNKHNPNRQQSKKRNLGGK